jgi:hypothetical protein
MPSTFGRRELTGNTVPPNGLETRFHMIVRPTLPGRSVAPITATVSGRKIASSDPPSYPRTSCAGSPLFVDRFTVPPSGRQHFSLSAFQLVSLLRLRFQLCTLCT